ncbi:MAG: hypothetical protein R3C56_23135 [Pirellulaceae bacterium]
MPAKCRAAELQPTNVSGSVRSATALVLASIRLLPAELLPLQAWNFRIGSIAQTRRAPATLESLKLEVRARRLARRFTLKGCGYNTACRKIPGGLVGGHIGRWQWSRCRRRVLAASLLACIICPVGANAEVLLLL